MLKPYLKEIFKVTEKGDTREESYYPLLKELLENFATSNKKQIHITTAPKKTDAGNPDFRVWDGEQSVVGYIEAKNPESDLNRIEKTEQLKRYLQTFPNLILTNFFEFRLYRNGQLIDNVQIARPFIIHKLKTIPPVERQKDFLSLLNKFFSFSLPRTYTAKSLAIELARRTRFLKEQVIIEELKESADYADYAEELKESADYAEEKSKEFILGFYKTFQKHLLKGLTKEDFADLYAQTITYGLFAARTRSQKGFNRKLAYAYIPETIGILRDVFQFISLGKLPKQMEWILDDIAGVLATADLNQILHEFYHQGKGSDPIIHFYETFLAEYNPAERERRGVYYTPEPVVSYIVRSLNIILKEHFNKEGGFAANSVTVLDPAAGTLTFLAEASRLAVEEFVSRYGDGGKERFIKEHILKDFYAFELMMAPYAIGHLKMSFLLEELGYKLGEDDRFKLYLTNTLEMEELAQTELPGMASLSEESRLAGQVKKEQPILAILGNPPYSGISANVSEEYITITKEGKARKKKIKTWIGNLIENYKYVDGKHFGERKHWLQDDYVKFIRFAQWKIDQAGEGILGFITNHSYLDNPTFRGMRQSLMNSFNEIYILDLHGNSLKKEKCPDGSKDKNVFDIQQGVAIALFLKKKERISADYADYTDLKKECTVYHSEIWGLREDKGKWLLKNDIKTTKWEKLSPTSPYYFFVPREEKGREIYEKYWKVTDIFPVNVTGIVTARDKFVIDFDKDVLKRRIAMFRNLSMPDELIKQTFKLKDTRGWKFTEARRESAKDENWQAYFTRILYRPFDIRHIYYTQKMVDWPRPEVMRHMRQENLGLLTCRQQNSLGFYHVLVCEEIVESCIVSNKTREINYLFPLHLYPDKEDMFSHLASDERKPNLNSELLKSLAVSYSKEPTPEEIFYYIYGVLYSNTYRTKYAQFLKIDFPRILFTGSYELFKKMGKYGKLLTDLHLMKSEELGTPIAKFQGSGDYRIEKGFPRYNEEEGRAYISKTQYFEGIEKEVWTYQIGSYQVLDKWLKDRKGKTLSLSDIKHYCQITTTLKKTIEIQKEIDELYLEVEKEIIEH
ncbi:N-6 DNA methylase [Thermodesulfovibrionales bacterium]|nr:N-6 DNA methylase [Thermodesulfovibrionales bacterium]